MKYSDIELCDCPVRITCKTIKESSLLKELTLDADKNPIKIMLSADDVGRNYSRAIKVVNPPVDIRNDVHEPISPVDHVSRTINNICDLISKQSMIAVDYMDVYNIFFGSYRGVASIGSATDAVSSAFKSAYSEINKHIDAFNQSDRVLVSIRAGSVSVEDVRCLVESFEKSFFESQEALSLIGAINDSTMKDVVEIGIIALWDIQR